MEENNPMEYDYYKSVTADELIAAKRANREHARKRDKIVEEILNESSQRKQCHHYEI